ncbi:MAG: hypothetical protein GF317_21960 [Candidatus Lokiarchaeota archaeon]|nr:hypothetical protein [Candidatus Lokiarchaeota archaeon]MBD3202125.1 hypothetical protein [Candidatus Lokiarchaeota archaeon]
MINWIIGVILIIWIIINRFSKNGKVIEYPLGLPRGTVRAITTILIVAFPFTYLINNQPVPGLIINAIFILVAFYFEARKSPKERMNRIIKEIKTPEEAEIEEEKQKFPLYLPKYSVRISLIILLILILIINFYGPNVAFTSTNTIADILIIIVLYIFGTSFRGIQNLKEEKEIKERIRNMKDYQNLSDIEIIENLMKERTKKWKLRGKGIFSLLMFSGIIVSLIFYQLNIDFNYQILPFYLFSIRETLLLLVNVYYGFRD